MKKRLLLFLLVMIALTSVAQESNEHTEELEREWQAAIGRITQRLAETNAQAAAGDSTALAYVASLESQMAYVYFQCYKDYSRALPWVHSCVNRQVNMTVQTSGSDVEDMNAKWAREDIAKAYTMMALYYANGWAEVPKDPQQTFFWCKKAAEYGDEQGRFMLAEYYSDGVGVEQDNAQAVYWYEKILENEQHYKYVDALFNLGLIYYYGQGVAEDEKKAFELWLAAAKRGYTNAYRNVALWYHTGTGVKRNYEQAVEWAKKGSEIGDGGCTFILGVIHYRGQSVKRNYDKAFELFLMAAEQGYTDACQAVAECYYYGRGVERDYSQAKEWCQKGVDSGDEEAVKLMKKLKNK